ncbi:unnamed protein product, partial [Litomosoides sigmodontis]
MSEERRYMSQLYVMPAVDAVDAGKGQLEISINQGKVPNNVQMQGAGRCLVTFIPQYPGTYVIDVTFNGEQVQGCPIRVDILPKQVGQSVSTSIVSQQTTTVTSSPSVQNPTSYGLAMEDGVESSGLSVFPKHIREKSSDGLSIHTHTKSPDLLRKTDPETTTPITENRHRLRKIDDYDPIAREKEREADQTSSNLIEQKDNRLGYVVAQYGNGAVGSAKAGQAMSSRTFTDDGRGIVTSTYTAETRYSSASPARTAFEVPKSDELTTSITAPSDPSNQRGSGYDTRDKVKSFDHLEGDSSFITDSRLYDTKTPSEYRDLDSASCSIRQCGTGSAGVSDQKQAQLKYFGEESLKLDGNKISRSDVDQAKTTYEPYRSSVYDVVQSGGYARSKVDSDKLYFNGYSKHDDESSPKVPSFEAPIIASYGRGKSDIINDKQQKASEKTAAIPAKTTFERSEESGAVDSTVCYQKVKDGKVIMGESQQCSGVDERNYCNVNERWDDRRRFYDSSQSAEESFQTLSRDRDMELTFLPTIPQRTADCMREREDEKFGAFRAMDSLLPSQRLSKFEYNEREGHRADAVEEATLTPQTRRKLQEQKIRHEGELTEKRDETHRALKDDLQAMPVLDRDEFELSQSKPSNPSPISTPRATPRLSLKFGK